MKFHFLVVQNSQDQNDPSKQFKHTSQKSGLDQTLSEPLSIALSELYLYQ